MTAHSSSGRGHRVVPVSPDDVQRVLLRALAEETRRIRLTYGQRRAIVDGGIRSGAARA